MSCISFSNLCPSSGDTENVLLAKILQSLNEGGGSGGGGVTGLSVNGGPFQTGDVSIVTGGGGGTVTSVNGDPGPAVLLDSGEIPEGANLYFTEARVRGTDLAGFVAAPGTVTAADTVLSALEKVAAVTNNPLLNFQDANADADGVAFRNAGVDEVFRTVGTTGFVQFTPVADAMRLHTTALTNSFTFLATSAKADGAFLEVYGTSHATGLGGATVSIHDGGQFRIRSAPIASTVSRLAFVVNGTDGNVGIGQLTTPAGLLHINTDTTALGLAIFEQASADTDSFDLSFRKARGTVSVPSAVLTADALGNIMFRGYSGAGGYVTSGSIHVIASGTIASTRVGGRMIFSTGTDAAPTVNTLAMVITNQGNVGIGPLPAVSTSGQDRLLNVYSAVTGAAVALIEQYGAFSDGPDLLLQKNRGAAVGSNSSVVVGDELGTVLFSGHSGIGGAVTAASIQAVATGTVAASRVPGRLTLSTGTDAVTTVLTARMTLDNAGAIGLGPSLTPSANLDVNNSTTTTISYFYATTDGLASPTNYSRTAILPGNAADTSVIRTEAGGTGLTAGLPRILKVGSGPSVGTDIVAQSVVLRSGQSTGTGIRGDILFQQSAPGSTGSSLNAYTTSWTINTSGQLVATGGFLLSAAAITLSARLLTAVATLTDAATIATDASLANHFRVTLGGNRTLGNPTNPVDGQRVIWEFIQDGTGSRTITLDTKFNFGTDIVGLTLTTTAGARDFMTAIYNLAADVWDIVAVTHGF